MTDSITRREVIAAAAAVGAALGGSGARGQSSDVTDLTIAEAGERIARRDLSPVELTRAYLERIERLNPRVNAYITVTAEQALAQARALEAELASGRSRGPLHGIPIALKDNIDTAGIRTTAASAVYADRVPAEDAPVVTKLRDAGAVLLGKLNMHEFAYGGTCVVTHYGPVHNPWNLDYTPGGSSGGSAAAVAARLCAGALGTDTAASIRYPAACCGVTGLKATHGLASIRGIVPLSEMHDHVGPIARSVADCALIMRAIAGYDPQDPVCIRAEAPPEAADVSAAAALRIGVARKPFFEGLDAEVASAVADAIEVLAGIAKGTGTSTGGRAGTVEIELPSIDSFPVLGAEIYAYHAPLVADPAKRALYDPITLERIMSGANVTAVDYIAARRRMVIARNTIGAVFERADVIVTPTFMRPPPTIAASLASPPDESVMIRNTLPFDVLGLPTISVPCGFTRAGLPVGLQISGPLLGEARVYALAAAYEQAADWRGRRPTLA
ncbi:MAG TPA: amidase [Gammaproteobacteria bacterium]|nr:amidase [Gammaproteobacteria bacterium]